MADVKMGEVTIKQVGAPNVKKIGSPIRDLPSGEKTGKLIVMKGSVSKTGRADQGNPAKSGKV